MNILLIFFFSLSLLAVGQKDFSDYEDKSLAENEIWIQTNLKVGSACHSLGGYTTCAGQFIDKFKPNSSFSLSYLDAILEKSIKKDLKALKSEDGAAPLQSVLTLQSMKLSLLKSIQTKNLKVNTWAKTQPEKTPGLLFVRYYEEESLIGSVFKIRNTSIDMLQKLKETPGVDPELVAKSEKLINEFHAFRVSTTVEGGILVDESVTQESIYADFLVSDGKEVSDKIKSAFSKSMTDTFSLTRKPKEDHLSEYISIVADEVKRFSDWRSAAEKTCSQTPLDSCFLSYLKSNPPRTSSGVVLAYAVSISFIVKEKSSPNCETSCKSKLPFKMVQHYLALLGTVKVKDLTVQAWKSKNVGKPGVLSTQVLEEILLMEFITNANDKLLSVMTKLKEAPSTSEADRALTDKVIKKLSSQFYAKNFEGGILADPAISYEVVQADLRQAPARSIASEMKDQEVNFKRFRVLITTYGKN